MLEHHISCLRSGLCLAGLLRPCPPPPPRTADQALPFTLPPLHMCHLPGSDPLRPCLLQASHTWS